MTETLNGARKRSRPARATGATGAEPAVPDGAPTEEAIRVRAYGIYCARGCTPGRDLEDWFAAERALRAQWSRDESAR